MRDKLDGELNPGPASETFGAATLDAGSLGATAAQVQAKWMTIQGVAQTLMGRPSSTLVPGSLGGDASVHLADLQARRGESVEILGTLGEGGMGVVHLGVQPSLGREVAVKTVKGERQNAKSTAKLLQEARVTGQLEHPNIVPVYDILLDADERPQIILRRIRGEPWDVLLADEDLIRERFDDDPFTWKLRVFAQVCNAIEYAHSRGILHLDIKPENIMLGAFGEVNVVDWGIAMAFANEDALLPQVSACKDIVGTPCYLAPEMLEANGDKLGVHCDVYLLGATLYELVVGRPPHRGDTLMEVMHAAVCLEPELPDDCPEELAQLLRRALDRDPDKRPQSAAAVRRKVDSFLRHRGSTSLSDQALEHSSALQERLGDTSLRTRPIYEAYDRCRYGFRAALDVWPENEAAVRGHRELALIMIDWEIGRGRAHAASRLMDGIEDPPAALVERVALEVAALNKRRDELEALERDQDPAVGKRTRLFLGLLVGGSWTVLPFGAWMLDFDPMVVTGGFFGTVTLMFMAVLLLLGFWARDTMSKTALNRNIGAVVLMMLMCQYILVQGVERMGVDPWVMQTLLFFLYMVVCLLMTVFIDRRLLIGSLGYFGGFALMASIPDAAYYILLVLGICNGVLWLNLSWIWRLPLGELRRPVNEAKGLG